MRLFFYYFAEMDFNLLFDSFSAFNCKLRQIDNCKQNALILKLDLSQFFFQFIETTSMKHKKSKADDAKWVIF